MIDDANMRLRLQHVAAYRELRRSVQRSGRENVACAAVMLVVAYFIHAVGGAPGLLVGVIYGCLIVVELLVGLFKWLVPSAEAFIFDGLLLLVFGAFNLILEYLRFQQGIKLSPVFIFLGLFMLLGAFNRFKHYVYLRRLFADRPSAEHIAWFDELVREIQFADPLADELVLDLPTTPHWKAKLLGSTAFFVTASGSAVVVAGVDEFTLKREKTDRGNGYRRALLSIHNERYAEFEIDDVSWANYIKWMASQTTPQPTT